MSSPRRFRLGSRWLGPLAATVLAAGCVTNPVTGQRELSLMSAAQERAAGAEGAKQVAEQIGLVEDPALGAYVAALGQRQARLSPRQDVTYQFAIADMAEPNAFALPGGYVYVSRGLLAIANSEAEVANVIGHEIGHVAARHSAQRQTQSLLVGIGTLLGSAVAGAAGGAEAAQTVAQFGQVAGAGLIASYGRNQERQADEIGQKLAAGAGWNPAAMASFLQTLAKEEVLVTGKQRMPSFLDSHPLTTERVQTAAARAATLSVANAAPVARNGADFLARLEGLLVGEDPGRGVFQEELFLHPGLDFALEFPAGWETQNQDTAVAAQAPRQDAMLILEVQGPTGDPLAAAKAFVSKNSIQVEDSERDRIGGFDAYRLQGTAQSSQGVVALDLTWIAHSAGTFRITGYASAERFGSYARAFQRSAASFRTLERSERAGLSERRLRVVQAQPGESLAALSKRTNNAWSVEETAVANALSSDARLQAGQLVKIAESVPYRR